jgi:hypothetical protein
MKHTIGYTIGVVCVIATAAVGVGVAAAATSAGWTEPKAERMLESRAVVAIPSPQRSELLVELRRKVSIFRALQTAALDTGDEDVWWTYANWANRYDAAARSLRSGLRVSDADCTGQGRSITAGRFARFACLAISETVRIPSTELGSADGDSLPEVFEGEALELGPFFTPVRVRVTGTTSFTYE